MFIFYGKEMVKTHEKALIEIRLAGLPSGVHEFDFSCTAGEFNDPVIDSSGFSGNIAVKVVADRSEHEVAVTVTTEVPAMMSCDLCLAPVAMVLKGFYRVYYIFDQERVPDADNADEYRLTDRNTPSIDLTEDVRETLLLSIPMKVTCTGNPDCRIYRSEKDDEAGPDSGSSWHESLGKLKNKYR